MLFRSVVVNWLRTIKMVGESQIEVEVMELDAKGSPKATGRTEVLKADTLVLALGQETESEFLKKVPGIVVTAEGTIQVDDKLMTGREGVFAGGDMIPFNKTVTTAVGHGKKAARHIDAYLSKRLFIRPAKHQAARFDMLKNEWYAKGPRTQQPTLEGQRRIESFEETLGGLTQLAALYEARRCFSCGNCFECNTCFNVCPEQTIVKNGPGKRYTINMDGCSRCGLCVQECPCGAMAMAADPAVTDKASVGSSNQAFASAGASVK